MLRLPAFRSRPACIAIELDVLNRGSGNRRRSVIIRSKEQILQLSEILTNEKQVELTSAVVKINPTQTATASTSVDSEIFKI